MRSKRNRLGGRSRRCARSTSPARKKFSLLSRGFESLEVRSLLAVDSGSVSPWTNPSNRFDVNADGSVQPIDVLVLIDNINRVGARSLIASAQGGSTASDTQTLSLSQTSSSDQVKSQYLDVTGDSMVTPQDALFVINALNATNDPAKPDISIAGVTLFEGNSGDTIFTFPVTLSAASGQQVTVAFTTNDESAVSSSSVVPIDFEATSGTLTFAPGTTSQNITVKVKGDTGIELDETFFVTLSSPSTNAEVVTPVATGTIVEDNVGQIASISIETLDLTGQPISSIPVNDAFLIKVIVQDFYQDNQRPELEDGIFSAYMDILFDRSIVEPVRFQPIGTPRPPIVFDDVAQFDSAFDIGREGNLDAAIGIDEIGAAAFSASPGQPPQPFVVVKMVPKAQGNVVFTPAFATGAGNEVTVRGSVQPLAAAYIDFQTSAPLSITAPNPAPKANITINDVTVTEGNTGSQNVTFTVTASNNFYNAEVHYATADGSATKPSDYTTTSGVATFAAGGATTKTITVQVRGDTVAEAQENFFVNLFSTINATITDSQGVGTINDNDAGLPGLSIGNATPQNEGNASTTAFTFPVTISSNPASQVTVLFTTGNGSATTADNDYAASSGTLTFSPGGSLTQNITVNVNGDTKDEANETFTVTLSGAVNAQINTALGTGTINNDDASPVPALSVNDVITAENVAGGVQTFNVTLSQAGTSQITVVFNTTDGTAKTSDSDYTATSGTLTFAIGDTSETITVAVNNDSRNEANETYTVDLTNATGGATIADSSGTGTINNDDPQPSLTIGDAPAQAEGNSGPTTFTFPVTLSAVSGQQVTVVFTATNGTATTADNDFAATTGILTFSPGQTSKNVTVNVNGDIKSEANETFTVELSGAVNASIADGSGGTTINDEDPLPDLSIASVSLPEGNSGPTTFSFVVTLNTASGQQITVPFTTANDTATAGSDYTATSNILTFAPGNTSKTINVTVNGDTTSEPDELFAVSLGVATNADVIASHATGTIQNDDAPPGLSIADLSQNEGNSSTTSFNFLVTLGSASSQQVTVVYTTSNGSATTTDNDYDTTTGTLTFAPGDTSELATVLINGDTKNETNESFAVTLSNAVNSTISDSAATGTIQNDDSQPNLTIGDAAAQAEGDSGSPTTFTFPVTLSAISGQQVSVVFTATNGTATTADNDFTATTGTLVFDPGQTSKNVTVNVNRDIKNEANETFSVVLSNAVNAGIADGTGATTINNDDPLPDMSIAGVSLTEGNSGPKTFGFVVTLSAASGQEVTVNFATGNDTATAGSDYSATNNILTFAPGQTSKTINVSVTGDTLSELTESFKVNLTGATNANVVTGTATGEIINDDAPPGLSINDVTLTEGNSGPKSFTFVVSLAQASGQPITVQFATAGGNATAGTDYTAASGILTFVPGDTSENITVTVNGDLVNEGDETFNVTLSNASNSTPISIPTGIGTITNDDVLSLSIGDVSLNEGNSIPTSFTFGVTLSGPSDQAILVPFSTSNGTATAGVDYTATSSTLTFSAGETSKQVTVNVNADTTFESNETFQVNISTPAAGVNVTKAIGAATIVNDDAAPIVSIGNVSQSEGTLTGGTTDFIFTVSSTGATDVPFSVSFTTADGTAIVAPDTETVGRDYTATSGALTFAVGETSKTITVKVRADKGFETDENFSVNLTNATGATIGDGNGLGTIQNDDPVGSFDVSSIAGYVFIDTNNNGVKDPAEKPLAGVTLTLTPDNDSDFPGTGSHQTTTAADGTYKFESVDSGDYVLAEVQPGFYLDGADHVGTQGASSVANDTFHVRLDGGLDHTGNIFAERGLRPQFISKRLLIASSFGTGQGFLSSLNLSAGAAWMSLDSGIDGTLTVEADGAGAGTTTLALYDNDLNQVATSTSASGDIRVDWNGVPGEPYFVRVSGTNTDVDLRLTNLVSIASGIVTVRGTDGNDNFTFDASGSVHTFTINGVKYELNPANASKIVFEGGAGNDQVTLIDSAFDEVLNGGDDWLSLANDRGLELTAYGIESARAEATHGGDDVADLLAIDFALQLVGDWE